MTQRPHIQFVTDVLHLQTSNTDRHLAAISDVDSMESCGPQGLLRKSSQMANLACLFNKLSITIRDIKHVSVLKQPFISCKYQEKYDNVFARTPLMITRYINASFT